MEFTKEDCIKAYDEYIASLSNENKPDKKEIDENKIRSRYFTYILYPDNPYHTEYLYYLKQFANGFYIIHDEGDELYHTPLSGVQQILKSCKNKPHIHVFQIFKNARKADGILKSLPTMKYYQVIGENQNETNIGKSFLTIYDLPYITLPVQEVIKPLVEKVKPIRDPFSYATYLLHRDYNSIATGKKQYSINDINMLKSDRSLLSQFYEDYTLTDAGLVDLVMQIYSCSDGDINLFLQLCCMHSSDVIKYVQSHAYFINKFIIEGNRQVNDRIFTDSNSQW